MKNSKVIFQWKELLHFGKWHNKPLCKCIQGTSESAFVLPILNKSSKEDKAEQETDTKAHESTELSLLVVRFLVRTLALWWFIVVAFSQKNWYCFYIVHMVLDFGMSALFKEQEMSTCCGVIELLWWTDFQGLLLVPVLHRVAEIRGCKCFGFCMWNWENL